MKKEKLSFGVKLYNLWMEEQGYKLAIEKLMQEEYRKNACL